MESIDTSGKALVEHWKWAADKGLMNLNTARSLSAACKQVLGVLDGWEKLDIRAIDVDDVSRRFQNRRSKDFKPGSLEVYKQRFSQAVARFLEYADNPASWKGLGQERTRRRNKSKADAPHSTARPAERASPPPANPSAALVDYPFPLREGRFAYLRLPVDLTVGDVKRLTAYLNTLVIGSETAGEGLKQAPDPS